MGCRVARIDASRSSTTTKRACRASLSSTSDVAQIILKCSRPVMGPSRSGMGLAVQHDSKQIGGYSYRILGSDPASGFTVLERT